MWYAKYTQKLQNSLIELWAAPKICKHSQETNPKEDSVVSKVWIVTVYLVNYLINKNKWHKLPEFIL